MLMQRERAVEVARTFIEVFTDSLVQHASKEYGVPEKLLSPKLRISSSERFTMSRGGERHGVPWMCINIRTVLCGIMAVGAKNPNVFHFDEYKHIVKDRDIGELFHCSWQKYLAALICHEFAHVIQHYAATRKVLVSMYDVEYSDMNDAHGIVWQTIYCDLRKKFVNGNAFRPLFS